MSEVFTAVPRALEAFTAAHLGAAATISGAGAADGEGMLAAAAAALGPIGADFLAAYAPAQANNLAATLLVAQVHAAIGATTEASKEAIVASDNP